MTNTHEQREFWEMFDLLREVFPREPGGDLSDAVDAMRARGVGADALRSAHALGGVVAVKGLMRGGGS